jgi:hypothetical protein
MAIAINLLVFKWFKFNEQWSIKHCDEQGKALHVTIRINLPPMKNTCHGPFCRFTLGVYNLTMKFGYHNWVGNYVFLYPCS